VAGVTFDQGYFDALYGRDADPWQFRSSQYEKEKYAATLAALPRASYRHLLELGSSIGELTALLAERAARVTGVETSPVAIAAARERCRIFPHVSFVQAHLPGGDWRDGADAVVLSEVLYYLNARDIGRLGERLMECAPAADMVLVHWTGPTNYPMSGDDAAACFIDAMASHRARTFRTPQYRLDVLQRVT
jgi:SAM-dependent methyltransferase